MSNFDKVEAERDKQVFNDEAQELLPGLNIQPISEEVKQ